MIFITGASGQLGRALVAEATARQLQFMAVSRPEFDFGQPATIDACFAHARPDLVINAAAYTSVDAAEIEREAAQAGNHTGPERLACLCAAHNVPLIHISTDYVFDGTKGEPYLETDPTHPAGVYGLTKRDGETAVLATGAKAVILRTSWVYAPYGKNFLRTMLKAAQRTNVLRVVADQCGAPTAVPDLAAVILAIAEKIRDHGWQDVLHRHFSRDQCRRNHMARFCLRDLRGSQGTWPSTPAHRPAHHRGLAHAGKTPSGFKAQLRKAPPRFWLRLAAVARKFEKRVCNARPRWVGKEREVLFFVNKK